MEERPLRTSDIAGASGADEQADTDQRMEIRREDTVERTTEETQSPRAVPTPGSGSEVMHDSRVEHVGEPLLPTEQMGEYRARWEVIQASFVDEPRHSVEQADALVADLMQRLASEFSSERQNLEGQWDRGDDVSTEELRVALTRYRSFFDRLLAA